MIKLLGRNLPVTVREDATNAYGFNDIFSTELVIAKAADILNSSAAFTDIVVAYLYALDGFGITPLRSFTPCAGTANQEFGDYIFYLGVEDIKVNADPVWWAGCIIHDGGHAYLSKHDAECTGVSVEQMLTDVQINYMRMTGAPPSYVADLVAYRNDPVAIAARIAQAA